MPKKKTTPTTQVESLGPSGSELGRANYRAEQIPGAVAIFAAGWHPTPGYFDFFEQSPLDIYPPEFILRTIPPTTPVVEVLTPFAIWVLFGAAEKIKTVTVFDADGRHEIEVEQVPDIVQPKREGWVTGNVISRREAQGAALAQQLPTAPTTMATGEEGTGGPTTMAVGEEGSTLTTLIAGEEGPTTLAVGEEGPTTHALGEEGPTTLIAGEEGPTTLAVGEEGPTTRALGEEGPTTLRAGEEGPTTLAVGEEGPTTYALGEEGPTTLIVGEEGPTTLAVGEEGPTTHALGEEGPTTLIAGEESGGGTPGFGPFGNF